MTMKKSFSSLSLVLLASLSLGACTTTQANKAGPADTADTADMEEISDPLEGYNRAMFGVNDALDQTVVAPVARGYRAVVPHPLRMGLRNFLRNLRTPVNAANQLLQGDIEGVAHDLSRFAMNTTIGIGGLIDVAKDTGLEYEYEDFGQTLAVWGVGPGAYMVLPVMGSSSTRDTAGLIVDTLADPVRLYLYNTDQEGWYYARAIATGLDTREELLEALDDLRKNSFDYYAAVRSAYAQRRAALVADEEPGAFGASAAIPDYDEEDNR